MSLRLQRTMLAVLALSAAFVGGWATVAARSFYDSFPGGGRHWISVDGPYNAHLVRDVGGLYLALLVVTLWGVRQPELARLAGTAWLVFSVPHLIYHAWHLHRFDLTDKIGIAVTLGGTAVLAGALAVSPQRGSVTSDAAVSSAL